MVEEVMREGGPLRTAIYSGGCAAMGSVKRRLNVQVESPLYSGLQELAEQQDTTLTSLVEQFVTEGLARVKGEQLGEQILPILRELVQSELRRAQAELLLSLREELQVSVIAEMKRLGRRSDDRLLALLVRAMREAALSRRLLYRLYAQLTDEDWAQQAYQTVRVEVGQDLATSALQDGLRD